jgi:calcineurin-like phosphoesterase family protein
MAEFFTSDTHFHHNAIVHMGNGRPFATVEEMNETIIERWNERIGPDDNVYHLGDFALCGRAKAQEVMDRLNGRKVLIAGNHDDKARKLDGWAQVLDMAYLRRGHRRIVLCHYAMKTWRNAHHGSVMLFGHSHGNLRGCRQSLDVGVDAWDFRPVTLEEIDARLATLPPWSAVDHHIPEAA